MNSKRIKQYRVIFFTLLLSCISIVSYAQVAIGSLEKPVEGALLQLKTIDNITEGKANANKGLLLPRVHLSDKFQLYPMFLKNQDDNQSGPSDIYDTVEEKKVLDTAHKGLVVYNTYEDYAKDLCLGTNYWDGEKWNCLYYPKYGYEMDCNTIKVYGVYKKGEALDSSHKIELKILADAKAIGQTYYIKTEIIDGISFFGQGKITADATTTGQTVVLQGKGASTNREIKDFNLAANNLSGETCKARVYVVIPKKRMLVLGVSGGYGWVPGVANTGSYEVLKSPKNFGDGTTTDPIFPVEEIEIIYPAINDNPTSTQVTTIVNYLENEKVDICYIGQNFKIDGTSTHLVNLRNKLAEYLNNKGVLLLFWEGNDGWGVSIQDLFRVVFNDQSITYKRVRPSDGGGGIFKISDNKDAITSGPFGDASGKHWGEDASWAVSVSIPTTDIDVYSWADDLTYSGANEAPASNVTAFKHKSKNLIYFGDGGFPSSVYSANGNSQTSATICPFTWDSSTMHPTAKSNYGYGSGQKYDIYNSIIWANTMAWAIYQAEVNGINPPQN